ncbi:MAG: uracil-DNA glycosylase [Alphaproteobacteria bacterium]|nr:uracil-DNA glycosylase [Alphaproteobacteria bacterium]MBU1549650.1 uracil-DNA glycosylase [Alphaproteobacteria bacterium]MBU2336505.1 uracil-DNA glycosylase [Alphaproteobacteria bacterium]MBU2387614.1 uracil-DNA glycosylase [Alphaproteobacteria bacterium]|tara:strand:- start:79 stop:747 length:669 start_codon:yes stop_codon:yes gene_type:complete
MNSAEFVEKLAGLSFKDAFNPYSDACGDFDQDDAASIRRMNLQLVLDAAIERKVDSIWIARDLGYRGGRRTGLALTDEAHLADHSVLYGDLPLTRATKGPALAERTATVIWQTLNRIQRPVFLWNVFPLHPHESGDPHSNRCHTRVERNECRPLLIWLLEVLSPRVVVAVGRDAQIALADLGFEAERVRHPSYGGQYEFVSSIEELYKLPAETKLSPQLSMF